MKPTSRIRVIKIQTIPNPNITKKEKNSGIGTGKKMWICTSLAKRGRLLVRHHYGMKLLQNQSTTADEQACGGRTKPVDMEETFGTNFGRTASFFFFLCCTIYINLQSVFHSGGTERVQEWERNQLNVTSQGYFQLF